MENTRTRRPQSPGLPPSKSPGGLFRSKSRSSAAISLPENNSCAANTSQRPTIVRSKSATKSRTKNKDEENLNPLILFPKVRQEKPAGFVKPLKSSPSAWALSPGRSSGFPLAPPQTAGESAVVEGGREKSGRHRGGSVGGVLRFFRLKKTTVATAVEAEELHQFRVLQNRLFQWKYANVRAEGSIANIKTLAQVLILNTVLLIFM